MSVHACMCASVRVCACMYGSVTSNIGMVTQNKRVTFI